MQVQKASPSSGAAPSAFALFALGFRPFYLLASAFGALSILLWVFAYAGILPGVYHRDPAWHAHEMLYGFTTAVIVGFLFTAGRNWTQQATPTGPLLAALALLWLAGRILVFTPWWRAAAVVNAAFPIAAAICLAFPLARSGNRRNYFFVGLLIAMGVAGFVVHAAKAGWITLPAPAGLQLAIDIVLFIMAVMGGRVIPMFTNNGIPGTHARRLSIVERVALGSLVALLLCDIADAPRIIMITVLAVAFTSHGARLWLWQPWRTVRSPLVWILHAGYAWIVVHLFMRMLAQHDLVSSPLALHALTIGAIGSLTIGMMTRTAKGHTGRLLRATRTETAMYALVQIAAVTRVFGGLLVPELYLETVVVAGLAWSVAFAGYAIEYWPILSRPRIDGKPG